MSRKIASSLLALVLIAGLLSSAAPVSARRRNPSPPAEQVNTDLNGGKPLPLNLGDSGARGPATPTKKKNDGKVRVGMMRKWLATDDVEGELYLKRFKLRGIGDHIEVWVAHDHDTVSKNLGFQYGDCRNDERIRITDKQVRHLIREFDRNMYPKESKAFSRPPKRNGKDALLPILIEQRKDYYRGPVKEAAAASVSPSLSTSNPNIW